MVLSAGITCANLSPSTMGVSGKSAASSGQTRSGIRTFTEKQVARLLGHVLRMDQYRIPKVALRWTPHGEKKPGRLKTARCRTVIANMLRKIGPNLREIFLLFHRG